MDKFEKEVKYFIDLVKKNIEIVEKDKLDNISKQEMIFLTLI